MLVYKVELSEKSVNDIIGIARYISMELDNPEAASILVEELYTAAESLSSMPERHQIIDDKAYIIPQGIRRMYVKNYSIFYLCLEDETEVRILRVLYNKREWQNLMEYSLHSFPVT